MGEIAEYEPPAGVKLPELFPGSLNVQGQLDNLKAQGYTLDSVDVEWDGTVKIACKPPGVKKGAGWYNKYINAGKLPPDALNHFQPLFDWEKKRYPGEALEGGALVFKVEKGMVDTQTATGRVTRQGGGWSWLGTVATKSLLLSPTPESNPKVTLSSSE